MTNSPVIVDRPFRDEADFWRVRSLLVETRPLTAPAFNWDIRRWDGWHFHRAETPGPALWQGRFHLWETDAGQLVGAVHPEGRSDAYLQLHPDFRCLIEADMLAWAEAHLAEPLPAENCRQLLLYVFEYDIPRTRLMQQRGYEKLLDEGCVTRLMRFGGWPLPPVDLAPGYTLRATRPGWDDCQRIADVHNASFNRSIHTAQDYNTFVTCSPSFRHDLNLVAEAPDGSFAVHVGLTYDEANRHGLVEPVCTHPAHRRRRLARSLIIEGLHRLKALGAGTVDVDTGDALAANELYDTVGFTEAYQGYAWRKLS